MKYVSGMISLTDGWSVVLPEVTHHGKDKSVEHKKNDSKYFFCDFESTFDHFKGLLWPISYGGSRIFEIFDLF